MTRYDLTIIDLTLQRHICRTFLINLCILSGCCCQFSGLQAGHARSLALQTQREVPFHGEDTGGSAGAEQSGGGQLGVGQSAWREPQVQSYRVSDLLAVA